MAKSNVIIQTEETKKIKVIDLFSGVGGLTFGFYYGLHRNKFIKKNSFEILFANDYDKAASTAFSLNFPDIKMFNCSIEEITNEFLSAEKVDFSETDLVIGGPPCQSYSFVGKRENDTRSQMYSEYKRMLTIIKPKMFIFENVLGILSFKLEDGTKIISKIIGEFDQIGYSVSMKVLNALDFGVPQNRLRVFIVGTRKDTRLKWEFPLPLKEKKLTLSEAISDLPQLNQNQEETNYLFEPNSKFQRLMRKNSKTISEHFCGFYGERITSIIENLGPGEAHDDINRKVELGILPQELYLTSGYHNSYGRLLWDKPSGTITNNFSTPSAIRCIHPVQNRALTIREASRIQSFPDWFKFYGSKTNKQTQVGNAVPPLLAMRLAEQIEKIFRGELDGK